MNIRLLHIFLIFEMLFCGLATDSFAQKKNKVKKNSNTVCVSPDPTTPDQKVIEAESLLINSIGAIEVEKYNEALKYLKKAEDLEPKSAVIQYKLAEVYANLDDPSKAASYAKKAIELDPTKSLYYELLADIYEAEYRFEEEAEVYEELLINLPEEHDVYFDLGEIYIDLGEEAYNKKINVELSGDYKAKEIKGLQEKIERYFGKALSTLEKIQENYGMSPEITQNKQWIYIRLDQFDNAVIEGEKLIEEFPDELDYRLRLADLLYTNRKRDEAVAILLKAVEEIEPAGQAHLQLSDYYNTLGEFEKSEEHLIKAFEAGEVDIDLKVQRVQPYFMSFADEKVKVLVIRLVELLLEKHSDLTQTYIIHGDLQYMLKNVKEARKSYLKALEKDENNLELWLKVLSFDMEIKDYSTLVQHTEEALEVFPNQPTIWLYKGLGLSVQKDYEESVKALEHGRNIAMGNLSLVNSFDEQLGDSYNGVKEYEKSDNAYEKVLVNDPHNLHVLNNYSYFLSLRKEKLEKAKDMCETLLILAPGEPTYLDTYAWVLYTMGDYQSAKAYLERAVKDSSSGTIFEHYGDVLFKLGRENEALEQWQKAKELGGASELIDKKIADKKLYEE